MTFHSAPPNAHELGRVRSPDGEDGPWMTVTADEFVAIERGAAEARPRQPPAN